MRARISAITALVLLLAVSVPLPSLATTQSSSLTLTVYPDGSVNVAVSLSESSMQQPGTQPNATLQAKASTSGGQTTIKVSGTMSLPASSLKQAPYNYSNTVSISGSYSSDLSSGSIIVQAAPGISSPLTTFKLNYHGNSSSVTVSGNATLQYGIYGSGSGRIILNASTISGYLVKIQQAGLNVSGLNEALARIPYGPFSVRALTLNPVYGANSATVTGYFQMSGNMTALPFLFASSYLLGSFGTFTSVGQVTTTVVTCSPQAPAYCTVTLQNSGNAATSVNGCSLSINSTSGANYFTGEVSPADSTVPAGGSVDVTCTVQGGISTGSSGYSIYGTFTLSDGAMVPFNWVSYSSMSPQVPSTATTTASNSTQPSPSLADVYSAYSEVISSFQDYSYNMAYSGGVLGFSATVHAAPNLNLDEAMKLLARLEPSSGVNVTVSKFLNSTRVDISNFTASLSEVQQTSGEVNTQFSVSGLTIYPGVTLSGGKFNESALFRALGATQGNLTLLGGTSSAGSVNIELPSGVPTPTSSTATSAKWVSANMSSFDGVEFSVGRPTQTSMGSSTTAVTSSSSSRSGNSPGTSWMTLMYALVAVVVVVVVTVAAYFLRRSPKETP